MYIIKSTKSYFFDVDDTLVFSAALLPEEYRGTNYRTININGRYFIPHTKHIELIKDLKARGHTIVIHSAGGAEWAEVVVKALDIEAYVDVVMSKPDGFADDKPSSEWMSEVDRFYIPFLGIKK